MKSIILFINAVLVSSLVHAQNISNVVTEVKDNVVTVTYDLKSQLPNELYKVQLYSSLDNFQRPLTGAKGDIGDSIEVGNTHKITYDLGLYDFSSGTFDGQISFEVRAKFQYAPLSFINKFDNSYKKGAKIKVQYKGLKNLNGAKFVIVRSNRKGSVVYPTSPNLEGVTELVLPAHMHTGHFFLKLVNHTDNQMVESKLFEIKKGGNLILKVGIPAIILGVAGGYFALSNKSGSNSNNTPITDNKLPDPANP